MKKENLYKMKYFIFALRHLLYYNIKGEEHQNWRNQKNTKNKNSERSQKIKKRKKKKQTNTKEK